jgi:glycosyltransferase involved in cell wall biosynthesis
MMPTRDTLISVYLPTRNRAALLARAAESVLGQTHRNLELLIVDDGSTDDTPRIIDALATRDPRVKSLRFEVARGAPAARNAALHMASADLVTGIDDDDEMRTDRLAGLLSAFAPHHSLICSGAMLQSDKWRKPLRNSNAIITLEQELFGDLVGTQALILKERVLAVGGFDEQMPAWQDYDLWVRLIAVYGPALRIGDASYVIHADSSRARISDRGAAGAEHFLRKHGALMNPAQQQRQRFEAFALHGHRMTLADLRRFMQQGHRLRPLRYFLTSNLPALRIFGDLSRRARY